MDNQRQTPLDICDPEVRKPKMDNLSNIGARDFQTLKMTSESDPGGENTPRKVTWSFYNLLLKRPNGFVKTCSQKVYDGFFIQLRRRTF
jgi:hypothetical protein